MNIETLKKEEMASVNKLADLSVKISEANETLARLETTKTEYLKRREKQAIEQIEKLYDGSNTLLEKTHKNYEDIKTFYNVVSSYKDFLDENYKHFQEMLTEFEERNDLWDKKHEAQVKEFSRQEEVIKQDERKIKQDKKEIEKAKEQVEKDKILLEDKRQTLSRALERLKLNKK